MAVDKLVDSSQLNSDLTSVANAIRAKSGGSGQLAFPSGFISEIGNIPSGGTGAISIVDTTDSAGGTVRTITALDISDTTAVAADVAQGKYFYTADGTKTQGTGSGGGGITASTGVLTLASDVVVPGANQSIELPGIQLSFQPDFFWISMVRSSFDDITTPTNTRFYKVLFIKKTLAPPYRVGNNVSTDSTSSGDYYTIISANVYASTDVSTNGYALNGIAALDATYQPYWYLGSDGKVYFGRYSSNASACFLAGDYRYFAFKI